MVQREISYKCPTLAPTRSANLGHISRYLLCSSYYVTLTRQLRENKPVRAKCEVSHWGEKRRSGPALRPIVYVVRVGTRLIVSITLSAYERTMLDVRAR